MADFESTSPNNYASLIDAVERVTLLPQSRPFEQVMYEHLSTRVARYAADKAITFHPILLRTQFPENLKQCFVSVNELSLKDFKAVQLCRLPTTTSQRSNEQQLIRQSKMTFTTNDFDYTFTTDGVVATMAIETDNGITSSTMTDADYTAFLASIVYAAQYDFAASADPEASAIKLIDEPLLFRRPDSTIEEGLVERMIMTLGEFDGHAETITTTMFDTGSEFIEAELRTAENPRTSSVNNSMKLSRIIGASSIEDTVYQNEMLVPQRLVNHYAESVLRDLMRDEELVKIIEPEHNYEAYAAICVSFIAHIQPLLTPYERLEETF